MTTKYHEYVARAKTVCFPQVEIDIKQIVRCLHKTNAYIKELDSLFTELRFDVFLRLGQRNISGFLGEIFSRFLCLELTEFVPNPHPDGRPDVLFLGQAGAKKFYHENCLETRGERSVPVKANLTPFRFGGIEIKSTIGRQVARKKRLKSEDGENGEFQIGVPRIKYFTGLTYWATPQTFNQFSGLILRLL